MKLTQVEYQILSDALNDARESMREESEEFQAELIALDTLEDKLERIIEVA